MNTNVRARSCAHLFPPSKWAGLFPSAAYRRSAPPQLALGRLKWRCLGCFDVVLMALQRRKTGLFFLHGWRCTYSAHASWDVSTWIGYFCNTKGQRGFISTLAFIASHEACRRMAVFPIQLTGSHTRSASRGTRRATAVTPQPSRMSLKCSRAQRARCGVKGHCPLREPEGLLPDGGLSYSTDGLPHRTREPWQPSCHGGKTPANLLPLECPAPCGRGVGCRGSPPALPRGGCRSCRRCLR